MEVLGRGLELFFPLLGMEIIVQVLGLKISFHTIGLFIYTLITNILIDCANSLINFEKSFKGLQFGLDRVFKHSEFVLVRGETENWNKFRILDNLV